MPKQTIDGTDVSGQRVLMRVDFNVPLKGTGITDDRRVALALPSIKSVVERGGRLVLMSHLGRPDGTGPESAYSLAPVAERLRELLGGVTVHFAEGDCVAEAAAAAVASLGDGEALLLDNLRFNRGEKDGDGSFAVALAAYGDIYCNEAFGTAHRVDASMVAVPGAMEGKPRVAGFLLVQELEAMRRALQDPEQPTVAVVGGAKISDKLGALSNLLHRFDTVLVGGAMAYTLQKVLGHSVGDSPVENNKLDDARRIIDEAAASPSELILPEDHVIGRDLSPMTPMEETEGPDIPAGWRGLDIGFDTQGKFAVVLDKARTIVWNGPVGAFETRPFHVGTKRVAEKIAEATDRGAFTVVAGGDTAAAVSGFGLDDRFSHISTGGGATLALLEGRSLEAVDLLDEA